MTIRVYLDPSTKTGAVFETAPVSHAGHGDYLTWRDKEFQGETVDTLFEKVAQFQEEAQKGP